MSLFVTHPVHEGTVQCGLAVQLLHRLINDPDDDFVRTYSRSLNALNVEDFDDKDMLRDLRNLTESALEHVIDKTAKDQLEKFDKAIGGQMAMDDTMAPPMAVDGASEDDDGLSSVEEEDEDGGEDKPSERSELADRVAAELIINSATRPLAAANRAPPQTPATGRRGKLASESQASVAVVAQTPATGRRGKLASESQSSVRLTRTATKARNANVNESPSRSKK